MSTGTIESAAQFKPDPRSQARRWSLEIAAAKKNQDRWWKRGDEVVKEFLGERGDDRPSRLNLFHADVKASRALLYGKLPQVEVGRRFDDPEDDDARVAGEMLQRHLNTDIERGDDGYAATLRYALEDWTLPGLGMARVRYVVETEPVPEKPAIYRPALGDDGQPAQDENGEPLYEADEQGNPVELAPAVPASERKTFEECETDWIYWKDVLWSPCRTWHERRWVAFRAEMTKDEGLKRFGPIFRRVPVKERKPDDDDDDAVKDAWSRAEVWEIWSKEDGKVYWWAEGFTQILDTKADPLQLEGFFPCPKPLVANTTTSKFIPKPDFVITQDLYAEVDELTARIRLLVKAVKVAGLYDEASPDIQRLLDEAVECELLPAKNWAALIEKGGIAGSMQLLPFKDIAEAIQILVNQRNVAISALFQVNGRSDIMRGQAQNDATATEQRIKAGFASTRAQVDQDEFARFASDLSKLRAEVICKHFDPETIIERSNVMRTADGKNEQDPGLPLRAVQLLKSQFADYRIVVRPESISLPDLAQQKAEGVEFLTALGQFMQAVLPLVQTAPGALPGLLELLKWAMARFRGASTAEGVLDRMIAEAEKPKPPPPPDPRLQAQQVKAQADAQRAQTDVAKAQMGIQATRAQTQAKVIGAVADIARTRAKAAALAPPMAPPIQPPQPIPGLPPGPTAPMPGV